MIKKVDCVRKWSDTHRICFFFHGTQEEFMCKPPLQLTWDHINSSVYWKVGGNDVNDDELPDLAVGISSESVMELTLALWQCSEVVHSR